MFNFSWFFLRLAGILTFVGFLIDIELILSITGFLVLHINLGLKAILNDYIHIKKIKFLVIALIRMSTIEITMYALELLL
uniref:Succinate:cytochrome c oxidoreductase subunit 4 n=1 Tax=Sebdenia flabellata TaxID=42024 RepID=A0A0E3DBM6_9FLOR|nr:succinate:cytochrome c oxidoreductase subunit 4 [Sebdenia flabellata]